MIFVNLNQIQVYVNNTEYRYNEYLSLGFKLVRYLGIFFVIKSRERQATSARRDQIMQGRIDMYFN